MAICARCRADLVAGQEACERCGAPVPRPTGTGHRLLLLTVVCGALICIAIPVLAAFLMPNFLQARAQGQYAACSANLKTIASAIEVYAADNGHRHPPSLAPLVPRYLPAIPTCPAAQTDTYTESYASSDDPAAFTLFCSGHNHADPDTPRYHARK